MKLSTNNLTPQAQGSEMSLGLRNEISRQSLTWSSSRSAPMISLHRYLRFVGLLAKEPSDIAILPDAFNVTEAAQTQCFNYIIDIGLGHQIFKVFSLYNREYIIVFSLETIHVMKISKNSRRNSMCDKKHKVKLQRYRNECKARTSQQFSSSFNRLSVLKQLQH